MNILFVSDNYSYGGLETHIYTYFKQLKMAGHRIIFVTHLESSDIYFRDIDLFVDNLYNINQIINGPSGTLALLERLNQIIQLEKIDILHLHPNWSYFAGFIAGVNYGIPVVLTIHGKVSLISENDNLDLFLKKVILPNSIVISVNRNIARAYDNSLKMHYLPNPIDDSFWFSDKSVLPKNFILLISRLSRDKVGSVDKSLAVIQELIKRTGKSLTIIVAGDGEKKKELQEKYPTVEFVGVKYGNELKNLIQSSISVFGMGRVILETVFLKKPVFLTNYDGSITFIDNRYFKEAEDSNFNGSNLSGQTIESLSLSLEQALSTWEPEITDEDLDPFTAKSIITRYIEIIDNYFKNFNGYSSSSIVQAKIFRYYLELFGAYKHLEIFKKNAEESVRTHNELLHQKDEKLSEQTKVTEELYKINFESSQTLLEKTQRINFLKEEIASLQEIVWRKEIELEQVTKDRERIQDRLAEVYNSHFWWAATRYYNMRDNFFITKYLYRLVQKMKALLNGGNND